MYYIYHRQTGALVAQIMIGAEILLKFYSSQRYEVVINA